MGGNNSVHVFVHGFHGAARASDLAFLRGVLNLVPGTALDARFKAYVWGLSFVGTAGSKPPPPAGGMDGCLL